MSVYVGPLVAMKPTPNWRWPDAATMYADTLAELHAMATACDVGRHWFRDDVRLQHYLLTPRSRKEAVKMGAVEVDSHAVQRAIRARTPGAAAVDAAGAPRPASQIEAKPVSRGRDGGLFGEGGRML